MKKITVQSLLNEDSELISESTFKSIKKNGRMLTKVRQSIETQLNCQFEIVIYKGGSKGKPSHFLVDKKKINPDKYKAHGRKSVILQEDLNAIANFIGKQKPTKMIENGKKEVENSFTAREIFQRSFNLADVEYAARNCYVENYYELEALKLVEEHLDTEIRQQIDCKTLMDFFIGWFKALAKQYVEKTLANNSLDYSMSYYSFSDFTYDEEKGEKIKKPNFNKISEEEFNDFKIERKKYRESLSNDLTNKEKDKYVKEEMENIFNYSQVFEKYVFYDNYDLINNDFDVLECNQRLEKRLIKLAIENQNRYEVDGEPTPVEYATYRLKKFEEYALFCEKLYNKIFKLNGHDDMNESFYDSNIAIENNVSRMIKEYFKNKKTNQRNEKEKITKKVHLSEHHKQIFDNNQINDIFIQNNLELFARIVENHYEHTDESYKAYKDTTCEKIEELGAQKLAKLPKKIQEELEIRYSEIQKEPTWVELLENEILGSEDNKTQDTENINNYDYENFEDTSEIFYELYDSKKNVEDKRKENEYLEDLKGGNNYKSRLRELGIEDSEVYNYPKLFNSLTVINGKVPFTKEAYRKYRQTGDSTLKELAQKKIDAISKSEAGRCRMEEFKMNYEYEESEILNGLMDYIRLELEHQIREGYSLGMKLSIVDSILESDRKYFREEDFNYLKLKTDEIKEEFISAESNVIEVLV